MVEKCSKGVFKGSLHKSLVQVFKGLLDTRFLLRDLGTEVFYRCFQGNQIQGPVDSVPVPLKVLNQGLILFENRCTGF